MRQADVAFESAAQAFEDAKDTARRDPTEQNKARVAEMAASAAANAGAAGAAHDRCDVRR